MEGGGFRRKFPFFPSPLCLEIAIVADVSLARTPEDLRAGKDCTAAGSLCIPQDCFSHVSRMLQELGMCFVVDRCTYIFL